jgi:hypothetical protein
MALPTQYSSRPDVKRWPRFSALFGIAISQEFKRKHRSSRIVARLSTADGEFIVVRLKETLTILSQQTQASRLDNHLRASQFASAIRPNSKEAPAS